MVTHRDIPVDEGVLAACQANGFVSNIATGGSDTHMRLKEGIERFLISDVDNPAGSAQSQSEVPIMWDIVSATVESYQYILASDVTIPADR